MEKELKLQRTREQWAISDPKFMAKQSPAAIMYALQDAKRDIESLHRALEKARATHPADQVAKPGTKAVPVELLVLIEQSWRVPNGLPKSVPEHVEQKITAGLSQLRALLATPSPK